MSAALRAALDRGWVLADGGVGTGLRALGPEVRETIERHGGAGEVLNVLLPEAVTGLHERFLRAGSDAVTTNSFCADPPTLARLRLGGRTRELAGAAARLARAAADDAARDGRPRFVLGSLGPGLALPAREPFDRAALEAGYLELARVLLEGGVDALVVETCRDARQARAACAGARRALEELSGEALLVVSFTPGRDGRLAGGERPRAALADLGADLIAINCVDDLGTLEAALVDLEADARRPLGAWPNAGLPSRVDGPLSWPLSPRALATRLAALARQHDLRLVGGCCGTTPDHIAALAAALAQS